MKTLRIALFLCLALSSACRGKGSGPSAAGDARSKPSRSTNETYEDAFRIGRKAAADGQVTAETNKIPVGEPIYISFVVRNAPSGSFVKVEWKRIEGDVLMAEEQKALPSDGFVAFQVKDTSAWAPGPYRLVKLLGSQVSNGAPISWRGIGTMDLAILPR